MPAIDMSVWQGRVDTAEGALARRWHQVMRPLARDTDSGAVVLIGFACDAGVARNQGRTGAAGGPAAIRQLLRNMPVHECDRLADAGDIVCAGDALEAAQIELSKCVAAQLAAGRFPIVLGGGHEMAFGTFTGLAAHLAGKQDAPRIGIVNFDAHFDLRQAERGNSGTPFLQIARECEERGWAFRYGCFGVSRYSNTRALFETANNLGVVFVLDEQMPSAHVNTRHFSFGGRSRLPDVLSRRAAGVGCSGRQRAGRARHRTRHRRTADRSGDRQWQAATGRYRRNESALRY